MILEILHSLTTSVLSMDDLLTQTLTPYEICPNCLHKLAQQDEDLTVDT